MAVLSQAVSGSRIRLRIPQLDLLGIGQVLGPLCALAVALSQPVDFDYWWHRQTGEYIVRNLSVPTADPFAFTTTGKYWVDHEWLSQVAIFGIDAMFGYLLLFLCAFALGVAAWAIVYRLLRAEGLGRGQAWLISLAPLVIGASYWRVRPSMFTVFFLALLLSQLFAARRGERQRLWPLIPLLMLWANLHGGYVIGLVVLALFAGSQWWDRARTRGPHWAHAVVVAVAAFVATGINPYTYRIWLYPFTYFVGDNASLAAIDEWQSPNFHEMRNLPLWVLLTLGLVIGGSGKKFDIWRVSLLVVFGAMTMQSMRHQPLFAIVWSVAIGVSLVERWDWWKEARLTSLGTPFLNLAITAGGAAALVAVVFASPRGLPFRQPPTGGSMPYPAAGAAYVKAELPSVRVFNEYSWGGYLIDQLYPNNQVFIDGRADLHGALVVKYELIAQADGWRETFDSYGIEVAIIPPWFPLATALEDAGWRTAYRDGIEVVLVAPSRQPPLSTSIASKIVAEIDPNN